jgi:hypothetical protein
LPAVQKRAVKVTARAKVMQILTMNDGARVRIVKIGLK